MKGNHFKVIRLTCLAISILFLLLIFVIYLYKQNAYTTNNTVQSENSSVVTDTSTESSLASSDLNITQPTKTFKETIKATAIPSIKPTIEPTIAPHPDRQTLTDGFYAEPLNESLIQKITDVSYHDNENITYDDLRYLSILYVDFQGKTQVGEMICNKAIATDLLEIFRDLFENQYPIEKIRLVDEYGADDDLSCADNNTSCFNYREVVGTNSLSKHALGLAIDLNPFYNPYITYPDGVEKISPVGSEMYKDRSLDDPRLIKKDDFCYNLFLSHGFTWGGEWKSLKDYQHFQKTLP